MEAIKRARDFSNSRLEEVRQRLSSAVPSSLIVVTCGSYARREASEESDIDFFIIAPEGEEKNAAAVAPEIESLIGGVVKVSPSDGGAFANIEPLNVMLHNIGGEDDANPKFTRRMLFLLEGEWLSNEAEFKRIRKQVLEHYITAGMTDHQLALFLLNDVIRFYRTMCVDYEFKTVEGQTPKPWGIRNIKLVFSRKLLYAGGLFSVGLTADRARAEKIRILEELFDMAPLDRMKAICGEVPMQRIYNSYDKFLARLEDPTVRNRLRELTKEQRDDPLFRELKNEGHHFTRELLKLFESTFDSTHPIRRAVVF